mmetsp:Transcript_22805/g.39017  ORF Transcript_22805/g.39017 Transcript_22805/m.39017 type:complete len:137 (+) Transcript_22805:1-411(+)
MTMTMTAASTPPLHVLRGILRLTKSAAPTQTVSASAASAAAAAGSSPPTTKKEEFSLHAQILSQYRQSQSLPPHQARIQRQIARDYWVLRQDLTERARLHELDQGADEKLSPKELSRRAAARAGLQLPKLDGGVGE